MMDITEIGKAAKAASLVLKTATTEAKNTALKEAAILLRVHKDEILEANKEDLDKAAALNLTAAQTDRLRLDPERIEAMASALDLIATLGDPVGKCISEWTAPSGLRIARVRVPMGVIGVIYESRPNVTSDAAALCLKSGNACILRPGSESFFSSRMIAKLLQQALRTAGLPEGAVQMIPTPDREAVGALLQLDQYVDVIVPRGGKSLIARVRQESKVPVLAHLDGNCHVYVDGAANLEMAKRVVLNAKMRRTGICGAAEKMLVDQACTATHLKPLVQMLLDAGCEVRGDDPTCKTDSRVVPAQDSDWSTEYLDSIIAVKVLQGVEEAIAHIERYGSHHTDSIVTNDLLAAQKFLTTVDSAIVLHNASTQFADGGEFGMGAEIGIATGRLHARGPVGLEELTTYKNVVYGNGHIRK
ncbi:MAG: glutamate-5-semialdehyde dehydrogenase [Alphaproteobacteria bacterium]|nr:glutamate-5-semialdehyde dehydrogenase [Alphaproteobacteria bacterium]